MLHHAPSGCFGLPSLLLILFACLSFFLFFFLPINLLLGLQSCFGGTLLAILSRVCPQNMTSAQKFSCRASCAFAYPARWHIIASSDLLTTCASYVSCLSRSFGTRACTSRRMKNRLYSSMSTGRNNGSMPGTHTPVHRTTELQKPPMRPTSMTHLFCKLCRIVLFTRVLLHHPVYYSIITQGTTVYHPGYYSKPSRVLQYSTQGTTVYLVQPRGVTDLLYSWGRYNR